MVYGITIKLGAIYSDVYKMYKGCMCIHVQFPREKSNPDDRIKNDLFFYNM